jgi:3-dehydroquinate synthase
MALDLIYARRTGLLSAEWTDRILALLRRLGFELFKPIRQVRGAKGPQDVLDGLEEFREHLGGQLTIPMIKAPGVRLDVHEMKASDVKAAMDELQQRFS